MLWELSFRSRDRTLKSTIFCEGEAYSYIFIATLKILQVYFEIRSEITTQIEGFGLLVWLILLKANQ